jgi:1,4-dihydroxy-6-naphthoate synthase
VTSHAQAMEEEVMRKHIELYVNNYSISLGKEGKAAIAKFYALFANGKESNISADDLFI